MSRVMALAVPANRLAHRHVARHLELLSNFMARGVEIWRQQCVVRATRMKKGRTASVWHSAKAMIPSLASMIDWVSVDNTSSSLCGWLAGWRPSLVPGFWYWLVAARPRMRLRQRLRRNSRETRCGNTTWNVKLYTRIARNHHGNEIFDAENPSRTSIRQAFYSNYNFNRRAWQSFQAQGKAFGFVSRLV